MVDEKWHDLVSNIEEQFGIEERLEEEDNLEDDLGNVVKGKKEIVIFRNPLGKVKLERTVRPIITDKKMHYHKGTGGTAKVEFVVSESETSQKLKAFVFNEAENDWKELEVSGDNITF